MSRDRFTEKDETGRMAVMLDQNNQLLIEYSETENKDGSKTCTPTMVYAPFIDRLAEYEDLIFSPETLKAIIAEWKEWADAKNDGRLEILPVRPGDTLYQIHGPCVPPFGVCEFDGGRGWYRCSGERKCKPYIDTLEYHNPLMDGFGIYYFATKEEAEKALQEKYGKEKANADR